MDQNPVNVFRQVDGIVAVTFDSGLDLVICRFVACDLCPGLYRFLLLCHLCKKKPGDSQRWALAALVPHAWTQGSKPLPATQIASSPGSSFRSMTMGMGGSYWGDREKSSNLSNDECVSHYCSDIWQDDLMAAFFFVLRPPFSPIEEGKECCNWFSCGAVAKKPKVFLSSCFLY